ncbi:hypothetical protein [Paenibacillus sp. TY11]|uniref:hypothetical protein n=1 Tax=Paenibacillus sp. TY11 TaxID=3448633 RepID=UPI004039A080
MKKLTIGLLTTALMVMGSSSALASPSPAELKTTPASAKSVITPQAYDELSFSVESVKVSGGSATVTIKPYGGTGYFNGTITFPDGTTKTASSSGQGNPMKFDLYFTKSGTHNGVIVLKSGSLTYRDTVTVVTTRDL